ncbi:MAG: ATP-dependent Clp protease proteolytic subunit [Candidatus Colwellbacteria bacterium]|nr:ATP-dependent Clp protease proteolytic subunit [Candidatus Colwellbacteria bacterium]
MAEPQKDAPVEPKRLVRLDPIDEKLQALADRGILMIGGAMGEGSSNMLFLSMSSLYINRPDKPIWIVMKSEGGQVEEGFAMIDTIGSFVKKGVEVNIIGVGLVASMAVGVMQAGVKRYAMPLTQFMIYEVSQVIMATENASESEDRTTEIKRINDIFLRIVSKRTGVDQAKLIKDVYKRDLWLDAKAAKQFGPNGLIDEIIEEYPFEL